MDRGVKRDWQVRLAAVVIFVLGFVAGGLAISLYRGPATAMPSPEHRHFSEVLDQLHLTDQQRTDVRAIFEDARSQMADVRRECAPKFRAVRERTDERLRQVLTADQWTQFKTLTADNDVRHHHGRSDGDGPH